MSRAQVMNRSHPEERAQNLQAVLAGCIAGDVPDVVIADLTLDSREVAPNSAFVALPGARTHGVGFAMEAVRAGARAILWEPVAGLAAPSVPSNVALVAIADLTVKLGAIADRFFDAPSAAMRIVGVTGTNGKTTTAHIVADALQQLGRPAAYAGTLGYGRIGALRAATHTTPDCITLHRRLAELRDAGVRCLGMEISSHALDQHRVNGVRIDTAVFTNLTRDHLDYHGTLDAYGEAKAKLFAWPGLRHAVIGVDDAFGKTLAQRPRDCETTLFAASAAALQAFTDTACRQLFATRISAGSRGLEICLDGGYGEAVLRSRFVGDFNVENLLAAVATLAGLGVPFADALAALERCEAPPGRMETLRAPGKPLTVIDYAHTPDALEKALLAVRAHCSGVVICVFGCGGERDPGKRPLMGAIAERLADRIVITDDNPRGEDGEAIVADIARGLVHPARAVVERDRARAVALAIRAGSAGDAVLIAGKGHEDYQIVGAQRLHFSDREAAQAALKADGS